MAEGTVCRPAISVILPVYNVSDYIDKCISILKSQTLDDLEFIFVDDCSTDDSMKSVEKWAKDDSRVYIINNKENIGSGLSRNKGIEAARGEYLAFADPDDWMEKDFYELLFSKATNEGYPDIVKGRCCKVDSKKSVAVEPENFQNERIRTGLAKGSSLYRLFTYEHWTAIYNRRLFDNKDVRYGRSATSQDTTFQLCATYHAKDIVLEDNAIYYYLQRNDSAINADAMKRTMGNLDSIDEKIDFLLKKPYEAQFGNYLKQTIDSVLRAYQNALGKGLISREAFEMVSERLSSSLKRFPDYDKKFEKLPRLTSLIKGRKYTKEDWQNPKEGRIRISVIIPVYNPGDAIKVCIESLRSQLLSGLEFIFVDDCSTDRSIEQVEQWALNDTRVHIIHNEKNLGAGASRNIGIACAKGEYLAFIDSDDYISSDFFEFLFAKAKAGEHDIAKGSVTYLYEDGTESAYKSVNRKIIDNNGQSLFNIFYYQHFTAIYKRKLFEDGKVYYGSSVRGEDSTFLLRICHKTNDVVVENNAKYYYIKKSGTLSDSSNAGKLFYDIDSLKEKADFLLDERDVSNDACEYIAGRAHTYWMKYLTAGAINDSILSNYDNYVDRILKVVNRFTEQKEKGPTKGDVFKRALIEYGTLLPDLSKLPQAIHKKAISMWTAFLSDNQKLDKVYIDRFIAEVIHYLKNKNDSNDDLSYTKADLFLRELLKNINTEYRYYVETKLLSNADISNDVSQEFRELQTLGTPEISVIIPMYNCERYVPGLLKMFSEQSFKDFEVICVIDGATDRTEQLVKEYCEKDRRFSYFYQKNGGAGKARNTGLDTARGKYIVFSDADDVYFDNYLERLYKTASKQDAQIVVSRFIQFNYMSNKSFIYGFDIKKLHENTVYSHKEIINLFKSFESRVTNRIYNAEFIRKNGLRFPETRISEDVFFGYTSLAVADRIIVLSDTLMEYRFCINPDCLTGNRTVYLVDAVNVVRLLYQWMKKHSLLNIHGEDYFRRVNHTLVHYSEGKVTPAFISECAHMLNAEEPWKDMTSGEILMFLEKGLFAKDAIKKEAEYKVHVNDDKTKNDKHLILDYNKCKNRIHAAELLRQVSLERYGRDFSKTDSLPDNVNGSSSRSLPVDDKKDSKQLIVSFTSYPARIRFVHQVLESLYAQSLQADKIILWLAEEQFPNKEEDLPEELLKDATTGKFELRWCDDLGSHKKYFYTMQECPHDIVVTVDDDIIYDSKMLETLYESYLRFPTAVSANQVSCMLFSSEGELLPCSSWILPYKAIKNNASLQLMAIGSRGILYPPGLFDKSVFDVKVIKELCGFRGTCFLNDSWLKIHELLNGISVVFTGGTLNSSPLEAVQEIRIKSSPENDRLLQEQESSMWKKMQNDHSQSDKFNKSIAMIKNSATFVSDEESGILDNVVCIFEDLVTEQNNTTECVFTQIVNTSIRELNRLKTLEVSEEKWNKYLEKYQSILLKITGRELSMDTLSFYALRDYGYILSKGLYGARYRDSLQYNQMLASWKAFFLEHPDCNDIYKKGYNTFTENMEKAKTEGLTN